MEEMRSAECGLRNLVRAHGPCPSVFVGGSLLILLACNPPDKTAPTITSSYPRNGAVGVPTNATLQVEFSELMDEVMTESAFGLTPATAGSLTWNGNQLWFIPESQLARETAYVMTLDTRARDAAGNRLESEFRVNFTTGETTASAVPVLMLGRSVMSGWFSHWGADPYYRGRFALSYRELESPPSIVYRVNEIVDSIPPAQSPGVFFKLCFVDFEGSDSITAQANLDRNLGYIQQVYDTVVAGRSLRLVVGNALPEVAANTDAWRVWNQRRYNLGLASFAAGHSDVLVFDLYGTLADSAGALRPHFASGAGDAHPNDSAYTVLDRKLFEFLEANY